MSKSGQQIKRPEGHLLGRVVSTWMGENSQKEPVKADPYGQKEAAVVTEDSRPIEPQSGRTGQTSLLKWVFFLLVVAYTLFSYFHAPILSAVGGFLMVRDPVEPADVIVCTPGYPVAQCLTAAALYKKGLSRSIFLPREPPPAGLDVLRAQGVDYPDAADLNIFVLADLGVPRSAIVAGQGFTGSLRGTARIVERIVKNREYRSLILVTPPWRARLARAVFKEALADYEVKLMMVPSQYSDFKRTTWWKQEGYLGKVFFEYEKLFYHTLKNLW